MPATWDTLLHSYSYARSILSTSQIKLGKMIISLTNIKPGLYKMYKVCKPSS